ncbi:AMP-binding protein [Intrasporangium sp.]|uniref:AMP-binding protein n=1 Tax=Intrasporangium sp. TaxID=1925024 RepID=UPI003221EC1F
MTPATTTRDLLDARAGDPHPGLLFEESAWSWDEFVTECRTRAHLLLDLRDPGRPFHVGVMLENHPDYLFMIGAAAYAGATVVGINLTRRGEELARDVRFTDCQLLVTSTELVGHLDGVDCGVPAARTLLVDTPGYAARAGRFAGLARPDVAAAGDPQTQLLLMFTSGSTGDPKAVVCTTGRMCRTAQVRHMGLGRDDVSYNAMPLFHGNALFACWANPLLTGGTFALARRFSASRFVDDLVRYRATFFNYVGRSLSYVLAQAERPQERQTCLRACYGTEASDADRREFHRRFGIWPTESYGASEGGLSIARTEDSPPGSLGLPYPGVDAVVLDPVTLQECPRAELDPSGRVLNAEVAIGELANRTGARGFEGYYRNDEATAERVRGDIFLTGDLGYRDEAGFFYFAGRGADRLRVDSENFSSVPVERILARHEGVVLAVVYPVPDERTGDQVMATLQVTEPHRFDPRRFADFLAVQPDLGTKWAPRYLRITHEVPVTATRKVNKPVLRREAWEADDPVYHRPGRELAYVPLDVAARAGLHRRFVEHGRGHLLPVPDPVRREEPV